MGNPAFTTMDAARTMKHVRLTMQNGGLTSSQVYDIMFSVFNRDYGKSVIPLGHHVNDSGKIVPTRGAITGYVNGWASKPVIPFPIPEPEVTPRKPCTVHREKLFTFKDGTTWRACTHDGCGWGKTTKKHSDGLLVAIPDVEATEDGEGVVEISPDDPTELTTDLTPSVEAGADIDDRPEEELLVEAAVEAAVEEVACECE
jgi:hypothetical protein